MKKIFPVFIWIFLGTVFFAACKKEPCELIICDNGAGCEEGVCICQPGYEGQFCSDEIRMKFVDNYQVSENCNAPITDFECTVSRSSQATVRIVFSNFANIEADGVIPDVYGVVNTEGGVDIPLQSVGGHTFEGAGALNNNGSLGITYSHTFDGTTLNCGAIFTPQ